MPTAPFVGLTSQIFYGITVSAVTTYTLIAQVQDLSGPEESLGVVEIGILGNAYKTKLPGQSDAGEVSFTVFFDGQDSTHQFLLALLGTQTLVPWKISYPDGSTAKFNGFLSAFGIKGMSADEAVTAEGTITLNSGAVFATS